MFRSVCAGIADFQDNSVTALSLGDQRISFSELHTRADRFAVYLSQLGVRQGCTVALCMERSFDWIVSALGILRAGAAYVPLDAAWPDSRLRFAVEDSGSIVVVARTALLDRLGLSVPGVDPARDTSAIARATASERGLVGAADIDSDSLAYLIYTSGSTGAPKGVEITHGNLCHLSAWHREAFGIRPGDRISHLAGLGFDAAAWELWPNLAAGATICLADDGVRSSPERIQQWMVREKVTVGFVPTIHAAAMMAMAWPESTALRFLLTGGDTLLHRPKAGLPFEVVNNYGPTECTVVATSSLVTPGAGEAPPIGRAISGAAVYLLDERGEPVKDGEAGEIWIGGGGVGRGYRNLPSLTEQSFAPDPFAGGAGRMYRSGDSGVRRADGQIEFRGRLDRQTKIRGQRVELDEIGGILSQLPSLEFANAVASVSESGENQLLAYVLPRQHARVPTVQELQKYLLYRLPDYMIPATFLRLESLPVSLNGKLDLRLLPQPAQALRLESDPPRPLATPAAEPIPTQTASLVQERLLGLVREIIKDDTIQAEDNFFLAGGHSLLGMQLVMRIRAAFNEDVSLQQLFTAPTVESLGCWIETRVAEKRIALIWGDLLGRAQVGLDANFYELGGHPSLIATLHERIAAELGRSIPISQLLHNATVRRQAELSLQAAKPEPVLPPGVLSLQPHGVRPSLFWIHYLNVNLAREFGDDQPIYLVSLAPADLAGLGAGPSLPSIGRVISEKILATQSQGPYHLGGLCIGSLLAFEVASQLRAAGHAVGTLVLLDAPSPSYMKSYRSLPARMNRPRFLLERMARLGLRQTVSNLRKRLIKHFAGSENAKQAWTAISEAHGLIESAAYSYRPDRYSGEVLLILASGRAGHDNFLPGWQALVPQRLRVRYVVGFHRELMAGQNVKQIAELIRSELESSHGRESNGREERLPFDPSGKAAARFDDAREGSLEFVPDVL